MYLPYKPVHSKEWLERYLTKNFYKKKYDRFMWWRSYTLRNNPLSDYHPLRDRIANGDFDLGSYVFEIELVEHRLNEKHQKYAHDEVQLREQIQVDKARRKRLQEDRDKDEKNKLEALKKAFVMHFNMTKEQYNAEVTKSHKDLLSFYDKMQKKYGIRGWVTRPSVVPKGIVLAADRC